MPRRILLLLIGLNACNGCAALIYQVAWFQMLQLIIGSSAVSLSILVGTVMGGMSLGSFAFTRIVSRRRHALAVYACIEAGLGVIGIVVLYAIPFISFLYPRIGAVGNWDILLRGIIAAVCLLPSALLIGSTLPALARWVEANNLGVSGVGFLYCACIGGAASGCMLTGFYLLRVYDVAVATYVAAAMNGSVAAVALALSRWTRTLKPAQTPEAFGNLAVRRRSATIYAAIALSGLCTLWAGAVWTRLLSLILGGSVYAFSIILAVFLFCLAIGSGIGAALSRSRGQLRRYFGFSQIGLIAAIAWAAYVMTQSLPRWPIDPTLSAPPSFAFHLDLSRCMWAILPATFLWGAGFPLALGVIASDRQDLGGSAGRVNGAHMIGSFAGTLALTLVWTNSFTTQHAQQVMIAVSGLAALLALRHIAARLAAVLLVVVFLFSVSAVPPDVLAYGRFLSRNLTIKNPVTNEPFTPNILHASDGINAAVAVSALPSGYRNLHVGGRIESSNQPDDLRLQRMAGHLAALYHSSPKSVLVVGFGSGSTAGTFTLYPGIERIVVCEIDPLVVQVGSRYFGDDNNNVQQDPRVEVVYDDARRFMLTTKEKFDIIASHPSLPWVKGAAAFYTREYFEAGKRRLNPGGVISQWLPLHETGIEVVKSEMATFFQVFPDGTLWGNDISNGVGYDITLMARDGESTINMGEIYGRLNRRDHRPVAESLQSVGFRSVAELFATYSGRGPDLVQWLDGAEINHDRDLRVEYLAGLRLNYFQNKSIYDELLRHRRFPDDLFVGSELVLQALHDLIPGR
ncbi:MAG TPA: fused MFS/spermidine synthase [Terriglobia bacterium]|nr:fused MFS/spermidine synthase [Terriglobia bacterium]